MQTENIDIKELPIEYKKHDLEEQQSSVSLKNITAFPTIVKPITLEKHFFLGASFAIGTIGLQDDVFGWFDFNTATNLSGEFGYYINNIVGLKTGITYFSLPYLSSSEKAATLVGIPTTLLVSIGDKAGFYSEIGAVFYFQNGNNHPIIAYENMIGFHRTSGNVDLKLGILLNITLKGKPNEYTAGTVFLGLNGGISIFL